MVVQLDEELDHLGYVWLDGDRGPVADAAISEGLAPVVKTPAVKAYRTLKDTRRVDAELAHVDAGAFYRRHHEHAYRREAQWESEHHRDLVASERVREARDLHEDLGRIVDEQVVLTEPLVVRHARPLPVLGQCDPPLHRPRLPAHLIDHALETVDQTSLTVDQMHRADAADPLASRAIDEPHRLAKLDHLAQVCRPTAWENRTEGLKVIHHTPGEAREARDVIRDAHHEVVLVPRARGQVSGRCH